MRSMLWPCIALAPVLAACASGPGAKGVPPAATPTTTEALLKAQTQQLLDAVTAGDPTVWDRYLDPQAVYVTEAGEVETKPTLLPQLKPLPAGISGKLSVGRFEVKLFGDVAIVVHVDEESVNYFGQPLHAQYLTSATWQRGPSGWKLIATHVHAALRDPPSIPLPPQQLDEYVGTYHLTDDVTYTIRRSGNDLVGQRTGRDPQPLRVEARDVLFVPGQPRSRKIFLRDARGQVTRFADRREARDILWTRR
jgi:hypothetical protein